MGKCGLDEGSRTAEERGQGCEKPRFSQLESRARHGLDHRWWEAFAASHPNRMEKQVLQRFSLGEYGRRAVPAQCAVESAGLAAAATSLLTQRLAIMILEEAI